MIGVWLLPRIAGTSSDSRKDPTRCQFTWTIRNVARPLLRCESASRLRAFALFELLGTILTSFFDEYSPNRKRWTNLRTGRAAYPERGSAPGGRIRCWPPASALLPPPPRGVPRCPKRSPQSPGPSPTPRPTAKSGQASRKGRLTLWPVSSTERLPVQRKTSI